MSESMIKVYQAASLTEQELKEVTARPRVDFTSILQTVRQCGLMLAGPRWVTFILWAAPPRSQP